MSCRRGPTRRVVANLAGYLKDVGVDISFEELISQQRQYLWMFCPYERRDASTGIPVIRQARIQPDGALRYPRLAYSPQAFPQPRVLLNPI